MAPAHKLPDQLRPGLKLVFVGTAAGKRSAEVGAYYAKPGNRFWRTLHETGITPRRFEPAEFPLLLDLGIGFTDMSKTQAGSDHEITEFDPAGFEAKTLTFQPRLVAFTSKKAASIWLARPTSAIILGRQPTNRPGFPEVHVLSSPSGAASGHWTIAPWHALAAAYRALD